MLPWKHTFTGKLKEWARTCPDREAYVFRQPPTSDWERLSITFKELDKKSSVLAAWLLEMGIGPGDRVAAVGDNCPGWLYLDYGCMKAKVLLIRISSGSKSLGGLLELLKDHHCSALFINPGDTEEILNELNSCMLLSGQCLHEYRGSPLRCVVSLTVETSFRLPNLVNILDSVPKESTMDRLCGIVDGIKPTDCLTTFCTSGSTGRPKIVVHTHQSFGGRYEVLFEKEGLKPGVSKYFNNRNFSWVGSAPYVPALFGITSICVDPKHTLTLKNYDFIFDVMAEEEVSHARLLSYMIYDITEQAKRRPIGALSSLRSVMAGGERMPDDVLQEVLRLIPTLSMGYGLTEYAPIARWDMLEGDAFGEIRGGVELKISDEGRLHSTLYTGEILVRGHHMFHSYLDDVEQTNAAFANGGWFRTGDVGKIDSRGRIQIMGRKSEVISHGNKEIYPSTMEIPIKKMPSVAQCVIVGVPGKTTSEDICAFIVPKEGFSVTEDDIRACSTDYMLQHPDIGYVPKYVITGDKPPTGSTGKVDRQAIRAMSIEKYA